MAQAISRAKQARLEAAAKEEAEAGREQRYVEQMQAFFKETGVQGKDGADGAPGRDGADGRDGAPGAPGPAGRDGRNGWNGTAGRDGVGRDGTNGRDGVDGTSGRDGRDGLFVIKSVTVYEDKTPLSRVKSVTDHMSDGTTRVRTVKRDKLGRPVELS